MSFEEWPPLVRPRLLANYGLEQEDLGVKPQLVDPRSPYQLTEILEGYSEQSLITMSQKRGLVMPWEAAGSSGTNSNNNSSLKKPRANIRKSQLITEIVMDFYDPASLETILQKLSPAARFGLALLKREGGIMRRLFWLMEIGERYGAQGIYQAESELVGSALALYAGTDTRGQPQSAQLRFRHVYTTYLSEIGSPAFMAESWLYLPIGIRETFELDPALLQLLAPAQVQPYAGIVARIDQPASHNLNVLLTDLFSFIRYIEREKFRIVQTGEISKRDTARLLTVLSRSNSAAIGVESGQKKKARPSDKITIIRQGDPFPFKGKTQIELEVDKRKEEGWLSFLWHLLQLSGLVEEEEAVSMTTAISHPELVEEFYALPDYRQARLLVLNWIDSDDNEFWRVPTLRFRELSSFSSESRDIPHPYRLTLARQLVLAQLQKLVSEEKDPANPVTAGQEAAVKLGLGGGWQDLASFIAVMRENYPELLISRRQLSYHAYYRQHGPIYQGLTSSLKGEGEALRLDLDWRLVEGEWLIQLFREPLAWLGLAELGLNEEGRPVAFRLTELGRKALSPTLPLAQPQESSSSASQAGLPLERSLIVQPNFEILVLQPLQQLAVLNKLDDFAIQQSLGEVALYRLSKESILAGLRRGLAGNEIVAFLEQHSAVPLSQNLVISIREWVAAYERLMLYPCTTLLEVSDPTQLDHIMSEPQSIQRLGLLKRVGPTFALLKGPPPPPVIEKLLPPPTQQTTSSAESFATSAGEGQQRQPLNSKAKKARPDYSIRGSENEPTSSNSKAEEVVALYFNYSQVQPGVIQFEGDRKIVVRKGSGNPYLYYRLGQFADLMEWEASRQSATFVLSAQAGQRALELGLDYPQVAAFLAEWKKPRSNLPPAFELRLKVWLNYFGEVRRSRAIPVRAARSEQLDDLFKLPELSAMLEERVASRVALIKAEYYERFLKRLSELDLLIDQD